MTSDKESTQGLDESNVHKGRRVEARVAAYLQTLGYEVVERNYTCKQGELDIVARYGAYLCFVEVRYRRDRSTGEPFETVGRTKQGRLIRAARHYLAQHPEIDQTGQFMRFDVVSVVGGEVLEMELLENAFEVGEAW